MSITLRKRKKREFDYLIYLHVYFVSMYVSILQYRWNSLGMCCLGRCRAP